MMLPSLPQATIAVAASHERFPIRRIYCVGRNYGAHAEEMGHDRREPPFFFMKPADAVVDSAVTGPVPPATNDMHPEVELVVALAAGGRNVAVADAHALLWGAAVGVDLTRRDLQAEAKAKARPWDMAKGFDNSAPIGPLTPIAGVPSLEHGAITLSVDGEERQRGDLSHMIWSVAETIAHLSTLVALAPGDIIMTGTPSGVGSVRPGQTMLARIDGLEDLTVPVGSPVPTPGTGV
ncbi:MAG: fumarylacetoacetate hydrolase family protein [Pseudomonadota bacterium]